MTLDYTYNYLKLYVNYITGVLWAGDRISIEKDYTPGLRVWDMRYLRVLIGKCVKQYRYPQQRIFGLSNWIIKLSKYLYILYTTHCCKYPGKRRVQYHQAGRG